MIYPNIAEYEQGDSILAIQTILDLHKEIERLNNIIKRIDKQNRELGAELSIVKDTIDKTNWWLEQMLKQAKSEETKAIISGTLDLLLGSDKE